MKPNKGRSIIKAFDKLKRENAKLKRMLNLLSHEFLMVDWKHAKEAYKKYEEWKTNATGCYD